MFTGIIETTGSVTELKPVKGNLDIFIRSSIIPELKIDQSVSHNGVCLTVVEVREDSYRVTAIDETLKKSNLGSLKVNDEVNLERCMKIGDRLDGHIVQGHVDQTALCTSVTEETGSWIYQFRYAPSQQSLIVEKGSICVNGISLTAFDVLGDTFKVAIIPYTYHATNIRHIKKGDYVNLEFDIVGKYIAAMMNLKP
jgi:riboflavin synthase